MLFRRCFHKICMHNLGKGGEKEVLAKCFAAYRYDNVLITSDHFNTI